MKMRSERNFITKNLSEKKIMFPAYQTSNRFKNLYSDIRIFIREVIQNADDAEASKVEIDFTNSREIIIKNNGHSFNSEDIKRILTPSKGGKLLTQTGDLNLGALSLLNISDEPWYHSGNKLIKFEVNHEKEDFTAHIDENYPETVEGTHIYLPLHSRLTNEDLLKLESIDEFIVKTPILLFTSNLSEIMIKNINEFIVSLNILNFFRY